MLLYALAFGLDWLFLHRLGEARNYFALFLALAPLSAMPALATLYRPWRRYASALAIGGTCAGSAGMLAVMMWLTRRGVAFPHDVLALNLMYWFFFCGLRFVTAFACAVLTVAAYALAAPAAALPFAEELDHLFVLVGVGVLGAIACYLLEWTERRGWLRAQIVEELSLRDDLTGLYNRRYLAQHATRVLDAVREGGRCAALLIMDVDFFKQFNDSAGHLAGDECLRRVAACLTGAVDGSVDVVARFGGDEFVILVHADHAQRLIGYGERVRRAVEALSIPHPALPPRAVTLSVGGAEVAPGAALSLDELLAAADRALYAGKAAGRNCVHWVAAGR